MDAVGDAPCRVGGPGPILAYRGSAPAAPMPFPSPFRSPRMSDLAQTDRLFFDMTGMDRRQVESVVGDALGDADDGELFLEYCQSESFGFDDGRLKSAS